MADGPIVVRLSGEHGDFIVRMDEARRHLALLDELNAKPEEE